MAYRTRTLRKRKASCRKASRRGGRKCASRRKTSRRGGGSAPPGDSFVSGFASVF